jgi:hypothetical protein
MRGNTFRPFGGGQVAAMTGDESRHDASCFADDVIIDFPSVAPAVERMRRAFLLDEHPTTFPAVVSISQAEASTGATVPLDVPVMCTCPDCGGRGEQWAERCAPCHGTGTQLLRHRLQVTVPAGVADGARFYFTVTPRHNPSTRIALLVRLTR